MGESNWSVTARVTYDRLEGVLNSYAGRGFDIYQIIPHIRHFEEVTVVAKKREIGGAPPRTQEEE